MVTLKAPWQSFCFRTPVQLQRHMAQCNETPPAVPEHLSPPLKNFLGQCFSWKPENRADAVQLLADPFLVEDLETELNDGYSSSGGPASARSAEAASWEVLKQKILADLQRGSSYSPVSRASSSSTESSSSRSRKRPLGKAASFHPEAAPVLQEADSSLGSAAAHTTAKKGLSRRATVPANLALQPQPVAQQLEDDEDEHVQVIEVVGGPSELELRDVTTAATVTAASVTAAAVTRCSSYYGLEMKQGDSGSVFHNPFSRGASGAGSTQAVRRKGSRHKLAPLQLLDSSSNAGSCSADQHGQLQQQQLEVHIAPSPQQQQQQQCGNSSSSSFDHHVCSPHSQHQHQHCDAPSAVGHLNGSSRGSARTRARRTTLDLLDLTSHQLQAMADHDELVYAAAEATAATTAAAAAATALVLDSGSSSGTAATVAATPSTSSSSASSNSHGSSRGSGLVLNTLVSRTAAVSGATAEDSATCCTSRRPTSGSSTCTSATTSCTVSPGSSGPASSSGIRSSVRVAWCSTAVPTVTPTMSTSVSPQHSDEARASRSSSGSSVGTIRALLLRAKSSAVGGSWTSGASQQQRKESAAVSFQESTVGYCSSSDCSSATSPPNSPCAPAGRNSSGRMSSSLLRRVLYSRRVAAAAAATAAAVTITAAATAAAAAEPSSSSSSPDSASSDKQVLARTRSERGRRLVIPIIDRNVVSESRLRLAVALEDVCEEECHAACLTVAKDATLC
jgi:trimeric autotransporter adhesin